MTCDRRPDGMSIVVPDAPGAAPQTTGERILVVDDEESVRRLLKRILEAGGWAPALAVDAADARRQLGRESFALALCDVEMPGESGLELMEHMLAEHPDTAVVMVSGLDSPKLAEAALELGAYGYVTKPFKRNDVTIGVSNALIRRRLEVEARNHRNRLEETVQERTRSLRHAMARLEDAKEALAVSREETITRLARAVEHRDPETGGHIERMSRYCGFLAGRLGIDAEAIRIASPLHDVGKIALPESILLSTERLTPRDRRVMERHAEIGYQILAGSTSGLLDMAATIAFTHHEWFDGTGYPRRLAGEAIPIEGRIAGVADVFDALTSDRSYRQALPVEDAVAIMRAERGSHFDPAVLDPFLESLGEVAVIMDRYRAEPEIRSEPAAGTDLRVERPEAA